MRGSDPPARFAASFYQPAAAQHSTGIALVYRRKTPKFTVGVGFHTLWRAKYHEKAGKSRKKQEKVEKTGKKQEKCLTGQRIRDKLTDELKFFVYLNGGRKKGLYQTRRCPFE
jgi:hypothetical protein